jgi:hypothetical protein
MAAAETAQLHAAYLRLSARFKAAWTFHQFALSVYRDPLGLPFPAFSFQELFDRIREAGTPCPEDERAAASVALDGALRDLDAICRDLLALDERISPSLLRRFFDGRKSADQASLQQIIRFYLEAGATGEGQRDKLDYLFTRMGAELVVARGEYQQRDLLDLRNDVFALVGFLPAAAAGKDEVVSVIRALRGMRDEIAAAHTFSELSGRQLLQRGRIFKHRLGPLYFHADVLLAVIDLNIVARNRSAELFGLEVEQAVRDAGNLLDNQEAIVRSFGESNPQLEDELIRFRETKKEFDEARAASNLKHGSLTRLKSSLAGVLSQLDRTLGSDTVEEELMEALILQVENSDRISRLFGDDPLLHRHLLWIASLLDTIGPSLSAERIAGSAAARGLRMETWEVAAYQKLYGMTLRDSVESDDLLILLVTAAALRMKIDKEATTIAAVPAGSPIDNALYSSAKASLDRAKALDARFAALLQDPTFYDTPRMLRQLYRSRFRLLRGFSGLWLIYDQRLGATTWATES